MESPVTIFLVCSLIFSFAAAGGIIAFRKRRRPVEGLFLGMLLGPVGVAVEAFLPSIGRPEVCENAWNSFQSMTTYQTSPSKRSGISRQG